MQEDSRMAATRIGGKDPAGRGDGSGVGVGWACTIGFFTWAQPEVCYLPWEGGTESFGELASNSIQEEISKLL